MTISVRAYARHRAAQGLPGATAKAVRNARDQGRLVGALTPDGEIIDADRADAAWAAHTIENRRPVTGRTAPRTAPDATGPAAADLPSDVPPLAVSRARREAALAEIAEAEARTVTGGKWIPVAHVEELAAAHRAHVARAMLLLRERLPVAVHRRIDLRPLAKLCADLGAQTKHVCGQPLPPLSNEQSVFRVAMHEIEAAVDEVLTEVADELERDADEDDNDDEAEA